MIRTLLISTLFLVLTGCQLPGSVGGFLGTTDPCTAKDNIHAAFLVFASTTDKITARERRLERTAYSGAVEYCTSGEVDKPTLGRIVAAYAAAVAEYKRD